MSIFAKSVKQMRPVNVGVSFGNSEKMSSVQWFVSKSGGNMLIMFVWNFDS